MFPPAIYPAPVASHGTSPPACPSGAGLERFTPAAIRLARGEAAEYGRKSLGTDLHNSDRAWWPYVRKQWRAQKAETGGQVVLEQGPAATSGYRVFLKPSCGANIVAKTFVITIGPPHATCTACRTQLFYVYRRGHALAYYLY